MAKFGRITGEEYLTPKTEPDSSFGELTHPQSLPPNFRHLPDFEPQYTLPNFEHLQMNEYLRSFFGNPPVSATTYATPSVFSCDYKYKIHSILDEFIIEYNFKDNILIFNNNFKTNGDPLKTILRLINNKIVLPAIREFVNSDEVIFSVLFTDFTLDKVEFNKNGYYVYFSYDKIIMNTKIDRRLEKLNKILNYV